jgi:acetyl esterase/lipase
MLEDVNTGIKWILDQAELYGGDLSSVFVVGQSAGGHLSSLALLSQAQHQALVKNNNVSTNNGNGSNGNIIVGGPTNLLDSSGGNNVSNNNGNGSSNNEEEDGEHQQQEGRDEKQAESVSDDIDSAKQESFKTKALLDGRPNWNINKIKGFVVVSGTYDLVSLSDHLHKRGLYKPMLQAIHSLHGKPALAYLSPTYHLANNHYHPDAVAALPPTVILHGTADKSVPIDNARQFYKVAKAAGMDVELIEWPGYSHTEPIVEGPMRGGRDEFMDRVLSLINGREEVNYQFAMCPAILIKFATAVCPF